ncbi:MAG: mechanosensitive ion channel [Candidatus Palauibacterales bacterium]|nr:mechanosensitive ion channel [Candidatus Palauibacterales bacterium]MDP2529600.1 mechanosensitive ion channel [Candidatus Palauibacterales bacterium]MDP2582611.1 mechanosensitive ion channel [Candidatus Palauibacterales bacterium]
MNWGQLLQAIRDIMDVNLFRLAGTVVTLGSIVSACVVLAVGWVLSSLVRRAVQRLVGGTGAHRRHGAQVSQRLVHYTIMLLATLLALDVMGVNVSALFAAGALFAVAIGFAMQNITQNFVSGVILLVERSIQPGDVLEVDGQVIRVEEMRIRSTVGRTRDDEELIVPNSALVASTVKNFTMRDSLYRVRAPVGVSYGSDMSRVRQVLEGVANGFPGRHSARNPMVLLTGFGSSSVDWETSVWIDDPWSARIVLSELQQASWNALKAAGITIAFPQLDLHLDADVVAALGGSGGGGEPPAT